LVQVVGSILASDVEVVLFQTDISCRVCSGMLRTSNRLQSATVSPVSTCWLYLQGIARVSDSFHGTNRRRVFAMQLSSALKPNCRLKSSGRYNAVHAPRLCVAAAAPTKPRPHQKRALHIVRVATPEVVSQHTMYVSGHAPCQLGRLTAVLLERNSGHHPEHWTPQGARCTAATEGGSTKRS
jgi:hypothetical protein